MRGLLTSTCGGLLTGYNAINEGRTASILIGAWFAEWLKLNAPDTAGNWRVAMPPQWDLDEPHNGVTGGSGFYVTAHSQNPEAAAIFVTWLNSHEKSLECLYKLQQPPCYGVAEICRSGGRCSWPG